MSRVTLTVEHNGVRTTREFDSDDRNAAGESFAKAMHDAGGLTWPMFTTVVDAMIDFMPIGDGDPLVEPVSLVLRGCEGIEERLQVMRSVGSSQPKCDPDASSIEGTLTMPTTSDFECKVCGATPDDAGCIRHGRGCYVLSENGGGDEWVNPWPPITSDAAEESYVD